MTNAEYEKARRVLMRRDPRLGAVIKQNGACGMADRQRQDHLTALIGAVVSQQLSTKAAATIFGRFAALFPSGTITGAAAIVEFDDFGRWTAEMFLMFRLHRPDVLPVGDLGIVNAVQKLYRLRKRPDPKRLLKIGEAWRPYRSVACWYLWQSLRLEALPPITRRS